MVITSYCFHFMVYLFVVEQNIFIILMFDIFLYDILLYTFHCFTMHSSVSFRYEYILLLNPMNSLIGIPDASSLNFPITFLFYLSKYGDFSGYLLLSNLSLSFQKFSYASSVSILYASLFRVRVSFIL